MTLGPINDPNAENIGEVHGGVAAIQNGVKETFDFVAVENADQGLIDNLFYGSLQTFPVGRYDQATFWLDNHSAGVGESCELRFGIYDSSFDLLREGSFQVTNTTAEGEEKIINFTELVLSNPARLYIVFGKNDEVGNMQVDSARMNASESSNATLIFTFNHASGALPANISAGRSAGVRVFYNAIFKLT